MGNPHDTVMFLPRPFPDGLTRHWKKFIIQASMPNDTRIEFSTDQKSLIPRSDLDTYEFTSYPKPNTGVFDNDIDLAFMRIVSPKFPIWVEKIKVCLHQQTTYGCVKVNVWDFGDSEDNIPVNLVGLGTSAFATAYRDTYQVPNLDDISWTGNLQQPPYEILIFTMVDETHGAYYNFLSEGGDATRKAQFQADLAAFENRVDELNEFGIRVRLIPLHPENQQSHAHSPCPDGHKPWIAHPDFQGNPSKIYARDGWRSGNRDCVEDGNVIGRPPSLSELQIIYNEVVDGSDDPPYAALIVDASGSMYPADMQPGLDSFSDWLDARIDNYHKDYTAGERWLQYATTYLNSLNDNDLKAIVQADLEDELKDEVYKERWKPLSPDCYNGCSATVTTSRGDVIVDNITPIDENIPLTVETYQTLVSNALADPDLYMVETEQECFIDPLDYIIQPNSILRFGVQYAEGNAYGLKIFLIGWMLECDTDAEDPPLVSNATQVTDTEEVEEEQLSPTPPPALPEIPTPPEVESAKQVFMSEIGFDNGWAGGNRVVIPEETRTFTLIDSEPDNPLIGNFWRYEGVNHANNYRIDIKEGADEANNFISMKYSHTVNQWISITWYFPPGTNMAGMVGTHTYSSKANATNIDPSTLTVSL